MTYTVGGISLGQKVRAMRLGYGACNRISAWVRVCDLCKDRFQFEVVPFSDQLPARPAGGNTYRDIRSGADEIISLIPAFAGVKKVKKRMVFIADEEGRIVA